MTAPSFQCPKCHGQHFVPVCPVYSYAPGRSAPTRRQVGDLVRCTRHACGRLWEVTNSGLGEPSPDCVPGRMVVRQSVPERKEREDDEREPNEDGESIGRARV